MTARPRTKRDLIFSPAIVAMASTITRLSADSQSLSAAPSIVCPLANHLLVRLRWLVHPAAQHPRMPLYRILWPGAKFFAAPGDC